MDDDRDLTRQHGRIAGPAIHVDDDGQEVGLRHVEEQVRGGHEHGTHEGRDASAESVRLLLQPAGQVIARIGEG